MSNRQLSIYTDGGARPTNPGPAAWGFLVIENHKQIAREVSFSEHATNNEMELLAISNALKYVFNELDAGDSVTLHSDSQYSIHSITKWMHGWKMRGWTTSGGDVVKNLDIMKTLDTQMQALYAKGTTVDFKWVKAHNGDLYNERIDQLVTLTIESKGQGDVREMQDSQSRVPNEKVVLLLESIISVACKEYGVSYVIDERVTQYATELEAKLHESLTA